MRNIILTTIIVISMTACAIPKKQNTEARVVAIEINGESWRSVPDFEKSSPNDKHYVIRTEQDSTATIVFGDGKQGARPPAETQQIKIRYARGRGYSGVRAQQGRIGIGDCR